MCITKYAIGPLKLSGPYRLTGIMLFRNVDTESAHNINLTVELFDDMRYYNLVFRMFIQDWSASKLDES